MVLSEDEPVARLTRVLSLGWGLSFRRHFRRHTGKWEPMPFSGPLAEMAHIIIFTLCSYIERLDFTDRNSGSDH